VNWATYLGSTGNDYASAVATDDEGNTYVGGSVGALPFFGTDGGTHLPGSAFITRIDGGGNRVYTRFLPDDFGAIVQTLSAQVTSIVIDQGQPIVAYNATYITADTQAIGSFFGVVKLDETGQNVLFNTYGDIFRPPQALDNPSFPEVLKLAIGPDRSIYFAGDVAFESVQGRGDQAHTFVGRLAPNGGITALRYLQIEQEFDTPRGLAVNKAGEVFVALWTGSGNLMTTEHAFQEDPASGRGIGADDAFVLKLDSALTTTLAATYLGGQYEDAPYGLALGPDGRVYVVGGTVSGAIGTRPDPEHAFPTVNPIQPRMNPGFRTQDYSYGESFRIYFDGFVSVLSPDLTTLTASTYIGGSGLDVLKDVAVDAAGNVYVVGQTDSLDFSLVDALQTQLADGPIIDPINDNIDPRVADIGHPRDFVIMKFDANVSRILMSTYFGGTDYEFSPSIAVDASGAIHVVGTTTGNTFPVKNAVQGTFAGGDRHRLIGPDTLPSDGVAFLLSPRGTVIGVGAHATEGRPFHGAVGAFNSGRLNAPASDFEATIDWGDGTQSGGTITPLAGTPGGFLVLGDHTYTDKGAFPTRVRVTDIESGLSPVSDINLSRFTKNQSSPRLASDPTMAGHYVAVMADENGFDRAADSKADGGILLAETFSGGLSWTIRSIATGNDNLPPATGDPDAVFDAFGNLHIAYVYGDTNPVVVVVSSNDGGATFDNAFTSTLALAGATDVELLSPTLAIDLNGDQNALFVTFRADYGGVVHMVIADAIAFGSGNVSGFNVDRVVDSIAGSVAVGPKGEVAFAWQGPPVFLPGDPQPRATIYVSVESARGPFRFVNPAVAVAGNGDGLFQTPALPRTALNFSPVLAWEGSATGGDDPTLYLVYADLARPSTTLADFNPDLDVFVVRGTDNGSFWGTPVSLVHEASSHAQFLPGLAVDQQSGLVGVTWYDTRDGEGGLEIELYAAASSDRGLSFGAGTLVSAGLSSALRTPNSDYGRKQALGRSPRPLVVNNVLFATWSDNSNALADTPDYPRFDTAAGSMGMIDVQDGPVLIRVQAIEATKGEPFHGAVASFTHTKSQRRPTDFVATIQWGDGSQSEGVIQQPGGPGTEFIVVGDHTYANFGSYPILVTIHDNESQVDSLPVSNVTRQIGSQSFGSIAIDPSNASHLFAAATDVATVLTYGLTIATSDDAGATWQSRRIADGSDGLPQALGVEQAVFDKFGNLFVAYVMTSDSRSIALIESIDGGHTFTSAATLIASGTARLPHLAAGPGFGTDGSVWLTWISGDEGSDQSLIVAAASVAGLGELGDFEQHVIATSQLDGRAFAFTSIAVGPDGNAMVSYQLRAGSGKLSQIIVQTDADGLGSQPFGGPVVITNSNVDELSIPAMSSDNNFVRAAGQLAWDRGDGPTAGRVYLVYTDALELNSALTDIFLRFSDDDGASWSEATILSFGSTSHFLPGLAIDQSTGDVAVGWYEAEEGNVTTHFHVILFDPIEPTFPIRGGYTVSAGSSDATDSAIDAGGKLFQYGLYTGMAFVDGVLQVVFGDNSIELESTPDPRSFEIANAHIGVAHVHGAPLELEGADVKAVEGHAFSGSIATFVDPSGVFAADRYHATIDWGDGTAQTVGTVTADTTAGNAHFTISGQHSYKQKGDYTIDITAIGPQSDGAADATAHVADAPFKVIARAEQCVVHHKDFTLMLGTVVDENPFGRAEDLQAIILWGDGSVSQGTVALVSGGEGETGTPTRLAITGTHTYTNEQTFTYELQVRSGDSPFQTGVGTLRAVDPPILLGEVNDFDALQGIALGDIILVSFTVDGDIDPTPGEYRATINWQDGTVDTNVIPYATSEDITVVGNHTFVIAGVYHPTVTLQDDSGNMATAILTIVAKPEITDQVRVVASGLIFNPGDGSFHSRLEITNADFRTYQGPFDVLIDELPAGVELVGASKQTADGRPSFTIASPLFHSGASFDPLELVFRAAPDANITFRVRTFANTEAPAIERFSAFASRAATDESIAQTQAPFVLENKPITAVEGASFVGAVATVTAPIGTNAQELSATIAWGDGEVTAATLVPINAPSSGLTAFAVTGSHTYKRLGSYDVLASVQDAAGHTAAASQTAHVQDVDHVVYHLSLDTSSLAGQNAVFTVQFNAGATGGGSVARAMLTRFDAGGGMLTSAASTVGAAAGDFTTGVTIVDTATLNQLSQSIRLGARIEFDVRLEDSAITNPQNGRFGLAFAVQLLAADGVTPLLTTSGSGAVVEIDINPDGSTHVLTFPPDLTGSAALGVASAAGQARVTNATIVAHQVPINAFAGVLFTGVVANFTNANRFETAGDHRAEIDWGDGFVTHTTDVSATAGGFAVSASHAYAHAGDYAVRVTIIDRDGGRFTAKDAASGGHIAGPIAVAPNPASAYDVDGDGNADLIYAGQPYSPVEVVTAVSIARGRGDGTFLPTASFDTGEQVFFAQPGDFNGDGVTDIAVFLKDKVRMYLGRGDGSYQAAGDLFLNGDIVDSGRTLDFDGDGKLDLFVTFAEGGASVLLSNGDGTFHYNALSQSIDGSAFAVGDVNGDGRPDVVTILLQGRFSGLLQIRINNGNGGLSFPPSIDVLDAGGNFFLDAGVAIGDVTGNGHPDILIASRTLLVLQGLGDGSFDTPRTLLPSNTSVGLVKLADLNGDGRLDILAGNVGVGGHSAVLNALLARADGGFNVKTTPIGATLGDILISDFDHDGAVDVLVSSSGYQRHGSSAPPTYGEAQPTYLLRGRGDGTFQAANFFTPTVPPTPRYVAAAIADINGDGHLDLIASGSAQLPFTGENVEFLDVYLGDGHGSFLAQRRITGVIHGPITVGDLNGDGLADVVTSGPAPGGGGLAILLSGPAGLDLYGVVTAPGLNGNGIFADVMIADIDGDGTADLITRAPFFQGVVILLGHGDGTFGEQRLVPIPPVPIHFGTSVFTVADFNRDGSPDLAIVTTNGSGGGNSFDRVSILLNDGLGGFGVPVQQFDADYLTTGILAADFNGDGQLDLALSSNGANGENGSIRVVLANPDSSFAPGRLFGVGNTYSNLRTADLNGDGLPDLITSFGDATEYYGRVALGVFMNEGDGTLGQIVSFWPGGFLPFQGYFATGDLTGDGFPDIVMPLNAEGGVGVLSNLPLPGGGGAHVQNPVITTTGVTDNAIAGREFSGPLASFTDPNAFSVSADFIVTVDWGDGSSSPGHASAKATGGFDVSAAHTYQHSGSFETTVTLRAHGDATYTIRGAIRVSDSEPPLDVTAAGALHVVAGQRFHSVVATINDLIASHAAEQFQARIDWGDGTTSDADVTARPGGFDVLGTHSYAVAGTYQLQIAINHSTGNHATVFTDAHVDPVAPNNHPPIVHDQVVNVPTGGKLTINLLAQAFESDGDRLSLVAVSQGAHGTTTINADSTVTYTAQPGFTGTDSFTYIVSDGHGGSATGSVSISVSRSLPPRLVHINRLGIHLQPTRIVLTFSTALDPARARDPLSFQVLAAGRDGRLGTRDDRLIRLRSISYDVTNKTVTLRPRPHLHFYKSYRLVVRGSGPHALTDVSGMPLDGNDNQIPGGDYRGVIRGYGVLNKPLQAKKLPSVPYISKLLLPSCFRQCRPQPDGQAERSHSANKTASLCEVGAEPLA
jgi:hypothetical protein